MTRKKAFKAKVFKTSWPWPKNVENWLRTKVIGSCLHLCCGDSRIGFRADIRREVNPDILLDGRWPPFQPGSWDTVICDPPWSWYKSFSWILRIGDIARKRLILSGPVMDLTRFQKNSEVEIWLLSGGTIFLRPFFIYTKTTLNFKNSPAR